MSGGLADVIRVFADGELTLDPSDINLEARANLMLFGFDPEEFDLRAVELALIEASSIIRARLAGVRGPVTFYAWYDEQAGQFRCSLASASPASLPFGGRFRPVDEPGPVLAVMATDKHPGVVLWEDLTEATDEGTDAEVEYSFPVFAAQVVPS